MKIGEQVPNLTLKAYQTGQFKKISLGDYKGKWVVLFFYPLDFTFVCPTELKAFAAKQLDFDNLNAVILGASTDSEHSHKAWFERDLQSVQYPILADTTHQLSRTFDVLKEDEGIAYRGTFLIDPEGILRYSVVSDLNVGRSVEETLRVLQALQTGALCPIDWKPGDQTLG